ncbi:uncharacterized protein LOC128238054 [Mya arenaria]|uniref:uncharacterized protein LOC128238054 n=1 Tax=Mya arenaria TaxID=6604 RepID=UPI0022E61B82|nr:uncharacterized protein LOC128238054 [Mya arenaria]
MNKASSETQVKRMLVYKWHKRFSEGRESICDDVRSGRPVSQTTVCDVEAVKNIVDADRRVTRYEICKMLDMSYDGSVRRIMKDSLKMSRVSARWVPRLLTEDEMSKRDEEPEYQKLVGIFRGDIRLRLIPKQILHLLFLIDEREKDKIRKIGDIDPAVATDLLLDSIKSSPDPGRWREFLNALEKTKFTCLLKKIRRHEIVDDTEQRKYVSIMMPQLREMINPREIMAHLLHHDLLISDDKQEIECVMSNKGAIEASELLLERVSGKHPNWYGILTKLLLKHGHKGAGDMLKVGFCKEPTTTQKYPPRSQSDSELMRTGKKSTTATKVANKRPTTHLEHGYTDYSLRTCTDEEDDERIYAAIDDTELNTRKFEPTSIEPKRRDFKDDTSTKKTKCAVDATQNPSQHEDIKDLSVLWLRF